MQDNIVNSMGSDLTTQQRISVNLQTHRDAVFLKLENEMKWNATYAQKLQLKSTTSHTILKGPLAYVHFMGMKFIVDLQSILRCYNTQKETLHSGTVNNVDLENS